MKERPILFSGAMVRAILDGRKSQTRRVVKPQPLPAEELPDMEDAPREETFVERGVLRRPARHGSFPVPCPFGQPGDRLWVRETFMENDPPSGWIYRATDEKHLSRNLPHRWKPSIHMPSWASRITLEIISVRVERVQECSNEDAIFEGVELRLPTKEDLDWCFEEYGHRDMHGVWIAPGTDAGYGPANAREKWSPTAKGAYRDLWDSINAERGHGWEKNPWVWVLEFAAIGKENRADA